MSSGGETVFPDQERLGGLDDEGINEDGGEVDGEGRLAEVSAAVAGDCPPGADTCDLRNGTENSSAAAATSQTPASSPSTPSSDAKDKLTSRKSKSKPTDFKVQSCTSTLIILLHTSLALSVSRTQSVAAETVDYLTRRNMSHLFPEGSWQRTMISHCRSRLAVKPRKLEVRS